VKKFNLSTHVIVIWLAIASFSAAGPKDPVEGTGFSNYISHQNSGLQKGLRAVFTEENGYIVAGPIDPNISNPDLKLFFGTVRVICPNIESVLGAVDKLKTLQGVSVTSSRNFVQYSLADSLPGFRGVWVSFGFNEKEFTIQFQTANQLRYLLWAKNIFGDSANSKNDVNLVKYAAAVSDYLYLIDQGNLEATPPAVAAFELPSILDFYAPAPDYVIPGYQNYKDYLFSYAEVSTDFAKKVLGFVPTKETLDNLKAAAPARAFPNKEVELLQEELRKFLERGGVLSSLRTLTKQIFDTLSAGEYFFAVGLNGNIRFGKELTREEVTKIEATGLKLARANHAFLFPGEPVLTAGAFFIACDSNGRLERVNTQSGHYFYSNITPTIKEDIAVLSDSYFLTIGHFFTILDALGIVYSDVVVTKL
jgi:hypothetical protein